MPVQLPRFDAPDGSAAVLHRGVPVRRVNGHLVTTVYDLMLAQYGVARDGLPGSLADGVRRRGAALHTGLAGDHHRRPGREGRTHRPRVRRERRGVHAAGR